jgi:hypothetical protein
MLCSWEEKWQEQKTTIVTTYSGNETLPEQLWASVLFQLVEALL